MAAQQQLNVQKTQRTALTNHIKLVESLDQAVMTREEHIQCSERLREIKQALENNHLDIVIALPDEAFLAVAEKNIKTREAEEQEKKEQATIIYTANAKAQAMALHPTTSQPIQMKLAKLPEAELPKFSGKYEDWMAFADRFQHTIHNRKDLSGAEKLKYLQAALQGGSGRVIESLSITDSNYMPAWDTVKSKYHHEREIGFNHLDRILDQACVPQGSLVALEKLKSDCNNSFTALKTLNREDSLGVDFIVKVMMRKLDAETRREFKKSLPDRDVPSLKTLNEFIDKVIADHATESSEHQHPTTASTYRHPEPKSTNKPTKSASIKCSFCYGEHYNYSCKNLLDKPTADRLAYVKETKVCTNCLSPSHATKDCQSKRLCKKCSKNHHTLLHKDSPEPGNKLKAQAHTAQTTNCSNTILPTAVVQIKNKYGQDWECRALIDNGSTHTFINSSLVTTLGLKKVLLPNLMEVKGLFDTPIVSVSHTVNISLTSEQYPETILHINALIVEKASGLHPSVPVAPQDWSHIRGLTLADPTFYKSRGVSLLVGADLYPRILHGGLRKGKPNQPLAQDTMFGFIISGPTASTGPNLTASTNNNCALDVSLQRFWEIEDCSSSKRLLTKMESKCEEHYDSTTKRNIDGTFEVALPFKETQLPLGNSKAMAYKRFLNLETKFQRNPTFKEQYCKQMTELIQDGHLELVPPDDQNPPPSKSYFLPHHGVVKESSATTKLRIVFDASAVTTSGQSLNQQLMVGPVLQEDLVSILIRWRYWKAAMTADVKQMYLYVWVKAEDRSFLRILWRETPTETLKQYRLAKVTFGTSCAPFQAIKTLQLLVQTYREELPLASEVVSRDFYVDDCLTGSNDIQGAIELQTQLLDLTRRGGFTLRKWSSSSPQVLQNLPEPLRQSQQPMQLDKDEAIKALGLLWNPTTDEFGFNVQPPKNPKVTKRSVLSEIARIFDPLGFLSPVTIKAKVLMQKLWVTDLGWDTQLSSSLLNEWHLYQQELQNLEKIRLPRWISQANSSSIQLHGFSDASNKAYAAVVYLRTESTHGVAVNLVASKTRVAPIKATSIPRLELCAAELLANLMELVRQALPIQIQELFGWTDSMIVLNWIQSQSPIKEIFVANRVTKIQLRISPESWFHVPGINNPADLPSRGIEVADFIQNSFWFHGPEFLQKPLNLPRNTPVEPSVKVPLGDAYTPTTGSSHPQTTDSCSRDPKGDAYTPSVEIFRPSLAGPTPEEGYFAVANLAVHGTTLSIIDCYSDLNRLLRHTVWWNRFWTFLLKSPGYLKKPCPITTTELTQARNKWIWTVQQQCLKSELHHLRQHGHVQPKSTIKSLVPYIDPLDGLLKAGGRLHNANIPEEVKHPVILPRHRLTDLLISSYHKSLLHAGPTLLWHMIRRRFWIARGKPYIRNIVSKCKSCVLQKAQPLQQLMAPLPAPRVTPSRPFTHTGVDYAGPVILRTWTKRAPKTNKAYIVAFVCFASKAVHLDLATDLTSAAFIAAFIRFVSRRGKPSQMYSDNGGNFVAANKELAEMYFLVRSEEHNSQISNKLAQEEITWNFNPPGAPHMGGLWEATVKSCKYHLKRVLGPTPLTYEEYATFLSQVEACLNSRPLWKMSDDPNEVAALTPGHFLIGAPLTAIAEPDLRELKSN